MRPIAHQKRRTPRQAGSNRTFCWNYARFWEQRPHWQRFPRSGRQWWRGRSGVGRQLFHLSFQLPNAALEALAIRTAVRYVIRGHPTSSQSMRSASGRSASPDHDRQSVRPAESGLVWRSGSESPPLPARDTLSGWRHLAAVTQRDSFVAPTPFRPAISRNCKFGRTNPGTRGADSDARPPVDLNRSDP